MSDIRSFVENHLDAIPSDEGKAQALREALDLALGQQKKVWRTITCKHCTRMGKYEVEVPFSAGIARSIRDLVELTKGKVPEQVNVSHTLELLPVAEMTTEDLHRLAQRTPEEVIEGEFTDIGPAEIEAASGSH